MFVLHGTWMRGGTSKCWLFNSVDVDQLVEPAGGIDNILSSAFGSGDPRQLDGVGGGSSTTSKAAIISRSTEPGIDVDYLFAQVAIGDRTVEWGSNCGNCATAIGLYALTAGLVPARPDSTPVRMRNRNTGAVLVCEVDTPGGVVPTEGIAAVPGTTALGVPVALTFEHLDTDPRGLLPTGSGCDVVELDGVDYDATMLVAGAPVALFDANDFGLTGSENNVVLAEHLSTLIELRRLASLRMGLSTEDEPVTHAIPKVGIVGPPADYVSAIGESVSADDYDVSVRMVSMLAPHPAIGLTSAVAVAAAGVVADSIVARHVTARSDSRLRIGTAAGVLAVDVATNDDGRLDAVTLHRAARRIATAELFVAAPAGVLAGSA